MEVISSPRKDVMRGVFLPNHLENPLRSGCHHEAGDASTNSLHWLLYPVIFPGVIHQHAWIYSRIQQHSKKKPCLIIDNTQWIRARKSYRIYWQDRQKITFPGSAYPKEILQQCTPATHTTAVHCQGVLLGSWGSSIPVSEYDHWRLLDPPWGEGHQTSHQPTDASTPYLLKK